MTDWKALSASEAERGGVARAHRPGRTPVYAFQAKGYRSIWPVICICIWQSKSTFLVNGAGEPRHVRQPVTDMSGRGGRGGGRGEYYKNSKACSVVVYVQAIDVHMYILLFTLKEAALQLSRFLFLLTHLLFSLVRTQASDSPLYNSDKRQTSNAKLVCCYLIISLSQKYGGGGRGGGRGGGGG
eukprot:6887309-Pyramimonas_sp.AAC.2